MRKFTSLIVTMLIMLSQFLPAAQVVIAESNKEFFNVNEAFDSNNQATKLKIEKKKEVETDRIELTLPSQVEFFEELSETKDATLSYKASENKIVLEEIGDNFNALSLVLKNYNENNSTMTIESYLSGDKLNTQKYTLKNVSKNDSIQEMAQNKELETIKPRVGNLNTDLSIESVKDTIESGTVAQYKMTLKLTGSKKQYQDAKLEILLPLNEYTSFNEKQLEKLNVAGTTPDFNEETGTLEYDFSTLDEGILSSGQTYEKIIRIDTKNGVTPNGTNLETVAKFSSKDTPEIEDKASVKVKASAAVTLSKKNTGKIWSQQSNSWESGPAKDGIDTEWAIKLEIPKKNTGQLYLSSDNYISFVDEIPEGLELKAVFGKNEEGEPSWGYLIEGDNKYGNVPEKLEYDNKKNTLRIEVPNPSIKEQEKAKDSLLKYEMTMILTVKSGQENKYLTNKIHTNSYFIGDINIEKNASDKVYVFSDEKLLEMPKGSYLIPVHYGPMISEQDFVNFEKLDRKLREIREGKLQVSASERAEIEKEFSKYSSPAHIPIVYDTEQVTFAHNISSMFPGQFSDYDELSYFYNIDQSLNLESLTLPKFSMRLDWESEAKPFEKPPVYEVFGVVLDENGNKYEKRLISNPETEKTYSREELGLNPNEKLTQVEYRFSHAPRGLLSTIFVYDFSIEEGAEGILENNLTVNGLIYQLEDDIQLIAESLEETSNGQFTIKDFKEVKVDFDKFVVKDEEGNEVRYGEVQNKKLQVVKPDYSLKPLAIVSVELNDHNNGEVSVGDNRMKVRLSNRSASPAVMTEDLVSVVMLPPGVKLKQNPNPSYNNKDGGDYEVIENYNNSGRDLVRIKWNQRLLSEGKDLIAELDVEIVESNSTQLKFDVYGYSGDEHIGIPEKQGDILTDTKLGTDKENLLGVEKPNENRPRLESGNLYRLAGQYDLQSQKFIKKSTDNQWTKDIQKVLPGELVDYKLSMTNSTKHTFQSMVLIDVLPSVGDLGITDNIQRGSQFTPNLNGPVKLPIEWVDKVDILYSTSKNPKRDDLIKNTKYPDGTTQLSNPEGSEDPNWMTEEEVNNNWDKIHSFKIEMKSEANWLPGENMDVIYQVKAPSCDDIANGIAEVVKLDDIEINKSDDVITVLDKEYRLNNILNKDIKKELRLTSNSFAVATDHGQPVEPKHVDFYMEIDSSLKIKKVDEKDKTPLAGAEFELHDSEGRKINLSQKLVTDKTGELFVEGLKPGKYKLKEIKAPKGYTLLTKDIDFEIACDNEGNELIITNSKQGWDLPSTGGIGTIIFYIVGLVIMGFAGYKWVSRKDKVKPN